MKFLLLALDVTLVISIANTMIITLQYASTEHPVPPIQVPFSISSGTDPKGNGFNPLDRPRK